MHYAINKLKSQIEKQKTTLLDDEGSLSIEAFCTPISFKASSTTAEALDRVFIRHL